MLQPAKLAALQREVAEQLRRFEVTAHGPTKTRRMQQLLQGVVLSGMEGLVRRAVEACKEAQAAAAILRVSHAGRCRISCWRDWRLVYNIQQIVKTHSRQALCWPCSDVCDVS